MWDLRIRMIDVTMVLDTAIYAAADVLAITAPILGATKYKNFASELVSIQLNDEDDQGAAFDIYFLDSNQSFGALNAPAAPTDAATRSILGRVPILTTDWIDLGGARVANIKSIGLSLKPEIDSQTIYFAVVNGAGTPTYTASGMRMRLGIRD